MIIPQNPERKWYPAVLPTFGRAIREALPQRENSALAVASFRRTLERESAGGGFFFRGIICNCRIMGAIRKYQYSETISVIDVGVF